LLIISRLVDEVADKYMRDSDENPTSSTILGPFWSPHAPFRELGASIVQDPYPGGRVAYMHGTVTDAKTGAPIPNAVVDIWQASANGKYDFQDDDQSENNLRGKFRTNEKGEYYYYCYHPTAYSLPTDGPAGALLRLLDRHPMRPAHIHLMVSADKYKQVTTQLFPRDDKYATTDTVFAVKDDLLLDFKPSKDPKADLDLEYNISLSQLKPGAPKPFMHTVF
jgi:protocatechuate 3,4-dioxygenase beta subunit